MANLPELKINKTTWSNEPEEIMPFEQAKLFPYQEELVIVAEGKQINSYNDLLKLALQEQYRDKKYIEVVFLPMIVGG